MNEKCKPGQYHNDEKDKMNSMSTTSRVNPSRRKALPLPIKHQI